MKGGNCVFAGNVWNPNTGGNYYAQNEYNNIIKQKGGNILTKIMPNPILNIFRGGVTGVENVAYKINGSKLSASSLPFKQSLKN